MVVILALIVTLMAILVAHGPGSGISTGESNQRLPRRTVTRLAVVLKMLVACRDRLRQEDCVIAAYHENGDKQQRQQTTHQGEPTTAAMEGIRKASELQLEPFGDILNRA
jgi:hypothetical protein